MTKKHQAELTAVAEKIYDLAANEIQAYIQKGIDLMIKEMA